MVYVEMDMTYHRVFLPRTPGTNQALQWATSNCKSFHHTRTVVKYEFDIIKNELEDDELVDRVTLHILYEFADEKDAAWFKLRWS